MKKRYILGGIVVAVVIGSAASCGGGDEGSDGSAKPSVSASAATDAKKTDKAQPSTVDQFKAYVAKNGTPPEKDAVKHVTKVQGADEKNNILDSAEIYTDFKGDIMDSSATGSAKLIASSFADFQASRGKDSKNGLVTVYNATGEILGNGKY